MRVLAIIPAHNEEQSIVAVVEELRAQAPDCDFVVVNDGSTDSTPQICREHGYPLVDLPFNLGLAGAMQAGMRYAWTCGYDCAVQIDADGQHEPSYIPVLARQLQEGPCDLVIGSRYAEQKRPYTPRMIASRMLSVVIKLKTGVYLNDPTSGMRMYSRPLIDRFAHELGFGPEPDTVTHLIRTGLRVKEVQVHMRPRAAGKSYLGGLRSFIYLMKMFVSIIFIQ